MSTTQSARLALPCILFTFEQRIVICDDRRLRAHAKILSVCGDIYDGNHGQRCSARLPIGWAEIMDGVHQGQTPTLSTERIVCSLTLGFSASLEMNVCLRSCQKRPSPLSFSHPHAGTSASA